MKFTPIGHLPGRIPSLPLTVETEEKWTELWKSIHNTQAPKVDFTTKKVIIIQARLATGVSNFLVKRIEKLSDETLQVDSGPSLRKTT